MTHHSLLLTPRHRDQYDLNHRRAAKEGGKGFGGGVSANEFANGLDKEEREKLKAAVALAVGFDTNDLNIYVDSLRVEAIVCPARTPAPTPTLGETEPACSAWHLRHGCRRGHRDSQGT